MGAHWKANDKLIATFIYKTKKNKIITTQVTLKGTTIYSIKYHYQYFTIR